MEGEEFLVVVREEIQKQMIKDWINWRTKNSIQIVGEWSDIVDHYPVIDVTIPGDEEIKILPYKSGIT